LAEKLDLTAVLSLLKWDVLIFSGLTDLFEKKERKSPI
jgi:hypothetical protein